jgi:hypothetical protein
MSQPTAAEKLCEAKHDGVAREFNNVHHRISQESSATAAHLSTIKWLIGLVLASQILGTTINAIISIAEKSPAVATLLTRLGWG